MAKRVRSPSDGQGYSECYFCDKRISTARHFCSGCGEVICEDCELNLEAVPHGLHYPTAHQVDATSCGLFDDPEECES